MNNNGPRMNPCGTPYVISRISDFSSLNNTYCDMLVK